jgi:UDP-N-acetylmuramoylalanine--D-glutamate ligase
MENYIGLKARVFENATESDWLILNGDDPLSSKLANMTKAKTLCFSRTKILDKGAWLEGNTLVLDIGRGREMVCKVNDIFIPGPHNLENAMAAVLISRVMGVDTQTMADVLRVFPGVEHRIELVQTIGGVTFYNDSKGTNIDSTIKAIESMTAPTVLIAGGYDKGSSFDSLIEAFGDTISHLVVLGQTSEKIMQSAKDKGFQNVYRVNTLEEGVKKAYSLAQPGENVLLSPACASWDMFKDFEERGRIFKESVRVLEEENR